MKIPRIPEILRVYFFCCYCSGYIRVELKIAMRVLHLVFRTTRVISEWLVYLKIVCEKNVINFVRVLSVFHAK